MSIEYYDHTSFPAPGSSGSSAAFRAELEKIEVAFEKLPVLSGNGLKVIRVNILGTALEAVPGSVDITVLDGVSINIQDQLDAKANAATTPDFTYVNNLSFSSSLPGQGGHAGEVIYTDGTNAFWKDWASFNDAFAADVATSTTPDIWTGVGTTKNLTGSVTVTGFAAAPRAGSKRKLIAVAGFAMTNSANLIIKGGSATLVAGDEVDILAVTTTIFRATVIRADGTPVVKKIVHYNNGTSGTFDYRNGESQLWTPASGAKTVVVTNWPATGYAELRIRAVNVANGGLPTWSGAKYVSYDGSFVATPALAGVTLQSVGTDFVYMFTDDGGANVYFKVMR